MRSEDVPRKWSLSASPPQPLLIGIEEVARLLGRSESSIRELDDEGWIPRTVSIGGAERWRLKELRSWVRAGCPDRASWESRWNRTARP